MINLIFYIYLGQQCLYIYHNSAITVFTFKVKNKNLWFRGFKVIVFYDEQFSYSITLNI